MNTKEWPYYFPVDVCQLEVNEGTTHRNLLEKGKLKLTWNGTDWDVQRVTSNPEKFMLVSEYIPLHCHLFSVGQLFIAILKPVIGHIFLSHCSPAGDSGLRSKPTNLGLGKLGDGDCKGNRIYGIDQRERNFTESDLTEQQEGSFQSLSEWYFKDIGDDAAQKDIDLAVYVGDYLYRQ